MIRYIYQKSLGVLLKKPFRLWGISLLSVLLIGVASAGFVGVPAAAWTIKWAFSASMAMIFLNSYRTGLEPKTEYLFSAFKKEKFLHVVGGMAWSALWIFLWCLIPIVGPIFGIVRAYEYRFVPYILMTRDDVKATDATKISKQETKGYKAKMFWADVLIVFAVALVNMVLGLFAKIPFVGVLFMIVLVIFVIACAALGKLFYGIMHAAFYVEIKNALAADTYAQTADAPVFDDVLFAEPVAEQPAAEDIPVEDVPAEDIPVEDWPAEEQPVEEALPAEDAAQPSGTVTCPICGAEVVADAKFCDHCGHKM